MPTADEPRTPASSTPDRAAATDRARRGIRAWVRGAEHPAGRRRSLTPYGILAFLTASAVAPVAGVGLGAAGEFGTALDQLGNIGSNYLADVLADTAQRMRDDESAPDRRGDTERWREAIAEELLPRLAAQDDAARALREEVSGLLRAVDAVSVALAESPGADERFQQELSHAFGALGTDVRELHWMAADAATALAVIQRELAEQGRRQRQQISLIRQSLVVTTQLRQDLMRAGAGSRDTDASDPVPGDGPADDVTGTPGGGVGPAGRTSPYPGLASFQPEDARFFHGRETLVAELLGRLAEQRTGGPALVVVGVSGAGKSSLLRAGLLPAIAAGGLGEGTGSWPWLLMTPGSAPLAELVTRTAALVGAEPAAILAEVRANPERFGALTARVDAGSGDAGPEDAGPAGGGSAGTGSGARPVIVVDQFEELFTQCADPTERSAFAAALAGAAPALVILAVRADFYAHCTELAPMASMLATGQVVLGPMTVDELRRAVRQPAERAGLTIESGLVELLLTDLGALTGTSYEPGALPLLGHALRATWTERDGNRLTVAGYRRTGGIRHAVAETAERSYLDMDADGRAALRAALLSLVTVADNRLVTRRRVGPDEVDVEVLRRLVDARLVAADRDGVEISHEALLSSWPRLAGWLTEAREEILLRQRLAEAARDWSDSGEDPDSLYRGARLAAAREWATGRSDLPPAQDRFLAASAAAAEAEEQARQRSARRLRQLVAGLTVALVLAVAGGLVALDQRATAETERRNAEKQRSEALSRQFAAESQIAGASDQLLSIRRALDAWDRAPTVEARGALLSAQAMSALGRLGAEGGGAAAAVSPDARVIAIGQTSGTIRLWDTATLTVIGSDLRHSDKPLLSLDFSPDGRYLASGSIEAGGIKVWEVAGGRLLHTLPGLGWVTWLPDSSAVLASYVDSEARFALGGWDPASGERVLSIPTDGVSGFSLSVSPDGRYAAMAGPTGAGVWRLADSRRVADIAEAEMVGFAADGTLISNDGQGRVRRWEIPGGKLIRTLTDESADRGINRFVVTPEGTVLLAGTDPQTVDGLSISDGARSTAHTGATETIRDLAVSADGKLLVVTGWDSPSTVYRRSTDWVSYQDPVADIALDPAGDRVAAASRDDGPVRILNLETLTVERTLPQPVEATSVAFAPDGTLASTGVDGTVRLYEPDGEVRATLRAADGLPADHAVFSPDGSLLAVAVTPVGDKPTPPVPDVVVWDVATLRQRAALRTGDLTAGALAFSPDGTRLVAASHLLNLDSRSQEQRSVVWVWRASDLTELSSYPVGPVQVVGMDISPDGRLLALAGTSQRVELREIDGDTVDADFGVHSSVTRWVAFSPDGLTLASASSGDPLIRLWDVRSGELTAQLAGHVDDVNALEFTPDGRYLVTGSNDRSVGRWQLDPDVAVQRLCRIVGAASRSDDLPVPAICR